MSFGLGASRRPMSTVTLRHARYAPSLGAMTDADPLGHPRHRPHRPQLRRQPPRGAGRRDRRRRLALAGVGRRVRPRVRRRGRAAHASYEALVADPDVDVVYVATPHAFHLENARLAFDAGKHVLCEKPLTLNLAEAEAMVAAAAAAGRFLMEAMWMACNPVIREIRDGHRRGPVRDAAAGARRPRVRRAAAADQPDVQPRARRRRPARHGHLPAHVRAPDARSGRHASSPRRR